MKDNKHVTPDTLKQSFPNIKFSGFSAILMAASIVFSISGSLYEAICTNILSLPSTKFLKITEYPVDNNLENLLQLWDCFC